MKSTTGYPYDPKAVKRGMVTIREFAANRGVTPRTVIQHLGQLECTRLWLAVYLTPKQAKAVGASIRRETLALLERTT